MTAIQIYYVLHVFSLLLLTAVTFGAFADPDPARRKRTLMIGGVLSLLMLTGGFGLLARLQYGWPVWALVKVGCWLWLSAAAGIAFRRPMLAKPLSAITIVVMGLAVYLVYVKPGAA
ncbi:MAG: hypothetical protein ACYSWX_12795 [Planctomycetota bacterium]|jgi:hypothetical protein